jgi:dihydrofolate synthase / folylpolyglutamate synthase
VPLVAQAKAQTTLDRVWPLMELLGSPQDRLKVIHVAGTSGKTSTAYYLSALLAAGGKKVGLTVSPHVDSVMERVQINGQPLSEVEFCRELGSFLEIVEHAGQKPTYFELLYAFALWIFDRQGVDYAVVETGMGGTHDATNVARREDKLCVITDIGLDHTHLLGETIAQIAEQKAGIIHAGNHVIMYEQSPEVMDVIKKRVDNREASIQVVEQPTKYEASYQYRNWYLAEQAYKYLCNRDKLTNLTKQVLEETQQIQVPARMEVIRRESKTIVMDGAHNAQKMTAFVESFQAKYKASKTVVLMALKEGKEYEELVNILAPIAAKVITTTFETTQDLPVVSMDPAVIAQAFEQGGVASQSVPNQHQALQTLMEAPEPIAIITGSFYLLSQIRNNEHLV